MRSPAEIFLQSGRRRVVGAAAASLCEGSARRGDEAACGETRRPRRGPALQNARAILLLPQRKKSLWRS